ncbi:CaiB/BaiF CoA-transferase family protein [Aliikangiella sp. G2MR2-5]|uniref:CaiB/BaiF CoA transferase family protein n=1 Tax=Aliikangiella sp. G2MR2-5 TaxID=2788943 RepID=UPI0018A9D6F0|nr:CaiB/BaiF CoA-transferase family protein [Aliikangiella sp. G2MR2-5]
MSLLTGIKVLDLSRILAGPWATQLLADYGAEVCKIERPGVGDDTRHWGPPFVEFNGENVAAYFLAANRGKKSLAIDISSEEGQEAIRQLAKEADILVENFKVGGLKGYGLDYDSLAKINPKLIYCSITGFGQTGPLAGQPGYDAMIQAAGGIMSITGQPESLGGEPTKVGVATTDLMTGMYAATAILAALHYRERSGKGQHIDLALFDCQLAMLANQGMNYLVSGENPKRLGNAHPNIVPYQTFACADEYIMLAVGNDGQFARLCELIGKPEWSDAEAYATNRQRVEKRELLLPLISEEFKKRSRDEWVQLLEQASIPHSPVNSIEEALNHPQAKAREMVKAFEVNGKKVPYIANPVKFSEGELEEVLPPPELGK